MARCTHLFISENDGRESHVTGANEEASEVASGAQGWYAGPQRISNAPCASVCACACVFVFVCVCQTRAHVHVHVHVRVCVRACAKRTERHADNSRVTLNALRHPTFQVLNSHAPSPAPRAPAASRLALLRAEADSCRRGAQSYGHVVLERSQEGGVAWRKEREEKRGKRGSDETMK